MNRKIKVLIGDNSLSSGVICADFLQKQAVDVFLSPRDGYKILETIRENNPDIVVMDAYLSRLDAIGVVKSIHDEKREIKIIVTAGYPNEYVERTLQELGINCYLPAPMDAYAICEAIMAVGGIKSVAEEAVEPDLETVVTEVILDIGIPAHVKGYHYARRAIMLCVEDQKMISLVTKVLYPTIAKEFGTTPSRVERAIRHAIEIAWDRGNVDTLNEYFGYTINNGRGKPTNSEFIAMLADKLRLRLKRLPPILAR